MIELSFDASSIDYSTGVAPKMFIVSNIVDKPLLSDNMMHYARECLII